MSQFQRVQCIGIVAFLVQASGCTPPDHVVAPLTESSVRASQGMGPHRRATSTRVSEAQAYFDQGLVWMYAFNHDEAIRSFTRAAELDPAFAMAWWGVAICHGPHINNSVMTEERSESAWEALQMARERKAGAAPVEQALIDALAARYAWPPPADRHSLEIAYADAMKTVHDRFPRDLDVATLYAEALMDVQPWDLWLANGEPKGNASEIVSVLESVLAANPAHPGAAHLYIHAVEASGTPQRALPAANALRLLVPASGHLLHMPSHIDALLGHWQEAAEANRRAVAADTAYRRRSPEQGFYNIYMIHNAQFLSFTCMMLGRSQEAIAAAAAATALPPADWVRQNAASVDGYMTVHLEALKRFGKWDALLALDEPPPHLPFTRAMWRFSRAVALAAKQQLPAARQERERFMAACEEVPADAVAQINPAHRVLELARHVLDGEIAYAARDYDAAISQLRQAIEIEASLQYMEPPDWMQPVRHTLGAVLIDAGRLEEAERAYREDLARWPQNGWALLGLARALEGQGKSGVTAQVRAQFERAWSTADCTPHASCLCAPLSSGRTPAGVTGASSP